MINPARGEAELRLGEKTYAVAFSIGAAARLSKLFEKTDIGSISQAMLSATIDKYSAIVLAVLHGNGHTDVTADAVDLLEVTDYPKFCLALFRINAPAAGIASATAEGNAPSLSPSPSPNGSTAPIPG